MKRRPRKHHPRAPSSGLAEALFGVIAFGYVDVLKGTR